MSEKYKWFKAKSFKEVLNLINTHPYFKLKIIDVRETNYKVISTKET